RARAGSGRPRRLGRVEPLAPLPGRPEPLRDELVDAAVPPAETAFGQLPVQLGGVREALSDPGVDPLLVAVQPGPVRTTETPRRARLTPQLAEHRPPRQAQFARDPDGRVAPPVELVDALEPLDSLLPR